MEHLTDKRKGMIMIAILVALFFSAINQTIIGVAMPRIISKLGGMDYYTWAISIYMLTSTVATVLVGKLSDIYGRKPFILFGIGFFMIGAVLSGFSTNIFELIAYRGISGMGAGIIMSTAFMAVGDLYAPRERARWTGILSGVFGLSSVFGPALGGYVVDHFDWHWVFWVFLPLGVVAFIMILKMFPRVDRKPGESIDYFGSIFLTLTIVSLLLAFSLAGNGPGKFAWISWQILGLFGSAAVTLVIFLVIETKVKSPVLPLSLFKNSIVTVSNMAGFLLGAGMMGAMIYVPFFVQGVKGVSPTYSGYIMMPMSIMMAVVTGIAGQVISKRGKYKMMAIAGLTIMTIAMSLLHFINLDTPIYFIIIYMCIFGIGLGVSMPVISLTVQNAAHPKELGVVTASSQLFRSLGSTIGIAVFGTVMSSRMAGKMQEMLASGNQINQAQIDPTYAEQFKKLMNPETLLDQPKLAEIQSQLPLEYQEIATKMVDMVRETFSYGLTSTFLAGAIVMAVAVIFTLFLKEIPLRSASDYKQVEGSDERKN
ncbi:MDR family MFS transporter [Brevibacillus daliensis]|uniref:MDR family MFS transporter n=1 Tax=Brevibacillus daliensis TaxID=2892995 RepID=UPI001E5DCC75|nr:MDR family MFS transporter [Brevibacillus daliensis]